jgi:hypothetical protein
MAKGEPKAHQLFKQLEGTGVSIINAASGEGGVTTSEWEIISIDESVTIVVNRTYIDLQGWTVQDLTTFTQGVDIQKQLIPFKVQSSTSQNVLEVDYITTRRLTNTELSDINNSPGFFNNTVDLMQVIYGERMLYAENATIPGTYVQISGDTFGSGNPTAMDKLHWTRLFAINLPGDGDFVSISAANLVVQAMTAKEKDLVWMERLRRSYVLQDQAGI